MTMRETISSARKEIMAGVLNDQNVAARTIVDLLYGILLVRITEGPTSEDAFDISKLLTYSLNRCIDPTRDVEHQHPIRNFPVHKRITDEIAEQRFELTFNRLADILVWLMHPDLVTVTSMEFYTTIPGLFLYNVTTGDWVEELIKNDKYTSELVHRTSLRADLVTTYPPRVDIEMDKLRWMQEFTKVAKHLDKRLEKMSTEEWIIYAIRCMALTSLHLVLTILNRSSSIEPLAGCAKPHHEALRAMASTVVYSRTPKSKG